MTAVDSVTVAEDAYSHTCEYVNTFVYKIHISGFRRFQFNSQRKWEWRAPRQSFSHQRKFTKFYHKTNISSEIMKCAYTHTQAHTKCRKYSRTCANSMCVCGVDGISAACRDGTLTEETTLKLKQTGSALLRSFYSLIFTSNKIK